MPQVVRDMKVESVTTSGFERKYTALLRVSLHH
jgi:hypothetical protein